MICQFLLALVALATVTMLSAPAPARASVPYRK